MAVNRRVDEAAGPFSQLRSERAAEVASGREDQPDKTEGRDRDTPVPPHEEELDSLRLGLRTSLLLLKRNRGARKAFATALQGLNDQFGARPSEVLVDRERRRSEFGEQEQVLQTMLRSLAEGVVVVDCSGRVLLENPSAVRIVGYPARSTGAARWCDAVGAYAADGVTRLQPDQLPTVRALRGEAVHDVELVLRGFRNDRFVRVEVSAAPLRDRHGAVNGAIANFRDITERKRAAEAEARLAALVRTTRAAVITCTTDGTVLEWNEGAARLLGFAPKEIRGRNISSLLAAGERRELDGGLDQSPVTYDREVLMRHKSGRTVSVVWTASSVRDESGRVIGLSGIGTDVSDRARLERQLALMADERRQELGHELHDTLGQQLTAIDLVAGTLKNLCPPGHPHAEVVRKLNEGIGTAKAQLRALIKGLAPVEVDASGLGVALSELAEATRRTHAVQCRLECPEPVSPPNNFVANQFYLIAREAVHNAIKHACARCIVIRLEERDALRLCIEDDGVGISRIALARNDAGLGLRIMRYRCRIAGGNLRIRRGAQGGALVSCEIGEGAGGVLDNAG